MSEFEKCYKLSENIQLASLLSYWTLEPSSSHLLPLDTQSLIVIYHLIDKIILNQHRSSLPGPVISGRSEPGLTSLNRDWILGEEPCQEHSDWTGLCFAFLLLSVELLTTS